MNAQPTPETDSAPDRPPQAPAAGAPSPAPPASHAFVGHTIIVSLVTLLSRFFGLLRDWALGYVFGLGAVMDAFVVAFMVPNLFRRLFGEGALAASFIPQYTRLLKQDEPGARRFARIILWKLTAALVAISTLLVLGLLACYLLGDLTDANRLTIRLTWVTIWFMPLICLTAIFGSILQVHNRFAVPAAAPIILNLFLIGGSLGASAMGDDVPDESKMMFVAWALVASGVVQAAWSWQVTLAAWRAAGHTPATTPITLQDLTLAEKGIMRQWAPTVLGLAIFQINTLMDVLIARFFSGPPGEKLHLMGMTLDFPMPEGSASALFMASRLYEFPLGVFGIAVATAIFPALSRACDDRPRFSELLRQGLRLTVYIGLPASVGLILIRHPACRAIYFDSGKYTAEDAGRIAYVLAGYAPAIWAYSMNQVLTRAFYAQKDSKTPLRIGLWMVGLNFVMNITLIWPLGVAGLAVATATCAILQCFIMLHQVRRYADQPLSPPVRRSWLKIGLLTLAMSAALVPFLSLFDVQAMSRLGLIGLLLSAVGLGAAVLIAGSRLIGAEELGWLLRRKTPAGQAGPPAAPPADPPSAAPPAP